MTDRLKVAILTTDARECWREYSRPEPYFGAAPEALLQGVPGFAELEIHIVSCWQKPMSAPQKLADNIFFHGLVVPKIGWLRTGYQGCIRAVRRKLQEIRPDVVHGQGTERECALCAAISGFPNVVTIHGNMAAIARLLKARMGSYMWWAARLEDFTLKRVGGVLCNSAYTEQLVASRTNQTWRVANPLRSVFFAEAKSTVSSGKPAIVNVGVISERKRQRELLQLARDIHAGGCEFELQFIGQADPQDSYARAFLEEVRSAEKVGCARYLGSKSAEELVECFDAAHAMIHFPSEEAFGLVVAEALARNLKFFGSREGGIMDIATGIDGVELFDVQDWSGLGDAIGNWIRKGSPRPSMAANRMRERYHPKVIVRRHIEVYRELLGVDFTGP